MLKRTTQTMSAVSASAFLAIALAGIGQNPAGSEAPAGFDDQTNGLVPQSVYANERDTLFREVDTPQKGLGPTFNQTSCAACHKDPIAGGGSPVLETRVGHLNAAGEFENPTVAINGGKDLITGRSLINDFSTCPRAKETIPATETIRAHRISLNTLGDGFVEAIDDATLLRISQIQSAVTGGVIHGQATRVDVLEAPGTQRVGRFGWKGQHASLLSFAADAYLNEQGITNRLLPNDVTSVCDLASDPEDNNVDSEGFTDIEHFARFIRSTKAPPTDANIASQPDAKAGSPVFDKIGCNLCHIRSITTAPAGTALNGGTFTVPEALGGKVIHPFSDFLLHDVGTGDGIVQNGGQASANRLRTPPLWGLRVRKLLMHDGASTTRQGAILRHGGEAGFVIRNYKRLSSDEQRQLLKFLSSL